MFCLPQKSYLKNLWDNLSAQEKLQINGEIVQYQQKRKKKHITKKAEK